MSKEGKIGLFAILILLVSIWGFTYLKGKNLLNKTFTFKTQMTDVAQLDLSSPVLINGFKVGKVTKVEINPDNLKEMYVYFTVTKDYHIPTDAMVVSKPMGVVDGRGLYVEFDHICKGDCAESGSTLKSTQMGLVSSMLDGENIDSYVNSFSGQMSKVVENIGSEDGKGALNGSVRELEKSMTEIAKLTARTNRLIASNQKSIHTTVNNLASISQNLVANNAKITELLSNSTAMTRDLKNAQLGNKLGVTLETTNATMASANKKMDLTVAQLTETMKNVDLTLASLNSVITKAGSNSGSLGMLMNDKTLYTNLESTSRNLSLLLQDLRLNPKRYVNVSIFGKKNKKYTYPKDDPANQLLIETKEEKQ